MRPKKSADESVVMIMQELRRRPDWSHVQDVVILPSIGAAPHQPNWKVAFTVEGSRIRPAEADSFATALSQQFDWDEKR
jgi:hypothetical protein